MEYNCEETKAKYVPHVIEPSIGVDRLFLAIICSAYDEDTVGGEARSVLRFTPAIAPIKVAILPLVKNKPEVCHAYCCGLSSCLSFFLSSPLPLS